MDNMDGWGVYVTVFVLIFLVTSDAWSDVEAKIASAFRWLRTIGRRF